MDEEPTLEPQGQAGRELSLLVVGEDTVQSYRLPERGEVVVGRAEGVGLRIREPWISRRHAILHIIGATLSLEDLGSANGTRVRDELLKPGQTVDLALGDVIELGSTTLVVARARTGMPPRRVRSKSHFEERLANECATSARKNLGFAVVRVRVGLAAHHDHAHAAVVSAIRPVDVLTKEGAGEYTILLARTTSLEAEAAASKIGYPLRARGVRVEIGVACYPQDGRDSASLLESAKVRTRPWEAGSSRSVGSIFTSGDKMLQVHALLTRVASGATHVVLVGEMGVGKSVAARQIHALSGRAAGPFLRLDCAALPEDLLLRELSPGGMLVAARGGTIFLEAVSDLPMSAQTRLLEIVADQTLDVRFVASTVRDLTAEVSAGRFHKGLLAQLKGAEIHVPPLRERASEIEELAGELAAHASGSTKREGAPRLSREALALLLGYPWPGNLRELRNVMVRAVLLAAGDIIGVEHLPREKLSASIPSPGTHLRTELEDLERTRILAVLESCGGNQSKAAKLLGISRNTLIARLNAYGVVRRRT